MSRLTIWLGLASVWTVQATACTCFPSTAAEATEFASVVFRGTPTYNERLPEHPRMKGRQRYAVTFRIDHFWKGEPKRTLVLYDIDPGTDCMGASYQLGIEYLVFAREQPAEDREYAPDDFAYGWTDVLAPGSGMLVPLTGCMPGGETSRSDVRKHLRELGRGKIPKPE